MISNKEREEMVLEAGYAICENASGNWNEDSVQYTSDAVVALAVFEPILRAEIEADYKAIQDEMDRLIEENERLQDRVQELEGQL